jgi:hypothetical protein
MKNAAEQSASTQLSLAPGPPTAASGADFGEACVFVIVSSLSRLRRLVSTGYACMTNSDGLAGHLGELSV